MTLALSGLRSEVLGVRAALLGLPLRRSLLACGAWAPLVNLALSAFAFCSVGIGGSTQREGEEVQAARQVGSHST